ncbi:MAG TPA: molybdopterin molybdenumtransferase MoeA [Planctomycetes bacterium]|nr:molybdopterin molybdenumtransferase MoeA [Planctomycetota bacterium]
MMTKDEALDILRAHRPKPLGVETVPLGAAVGRVLAEDCVADRDQPPFHRSAMDGYACRAEDLEGAPVVLEVVDVIAAGEMSSRVLGPGACAKIMTGAPVPTGADVVVMVEKTETLEEGRRVRILEEVPSGRNIAPRGQDYREGEAILRVGRRLRPLELGMLASLGKDPVAVHALPRVTVLATGDELVPPGGPAPGPSQIRESNGVMLTAQVAALGLGIPVRHGGIVPDDPAAVRAALEDALHGDVVILSGGVSMGDFDYVHRELHRRGLEVLIEKVAIKPGKPLLYGRLAADGGRVVEVFGLPGNPVSSFATFEIFVRPHLEAFCGLPEREPPVFRMEIRGTSSGKAIPRTQHLPVNVRQRDGRLVAERVTWHGSGDLRGMAEANGLLVVEAGASPPVDGEEAWVHLVEPIDPSRCLPVSDEAR